MSVSNPQKKISPETIGCQGTATVTMSFDATAMLSKDPADIVLIMDRSYSMNNERMFYAKQGAKDLINIVSGATAEQGSDTIGSGSRMGIVSFSSTATQDVQLTTNVNSLKNAITSLSKTSETNHVVAFEAAETMLGAKGDNRQVVIMFTDGLTTQGGSAKPVTDRMKANGVEIYCIGLLETPETLNEWASEPVSTHVAYTAEPTKVGEVFRDIAAETVKAGAQDIMITEEVQPDFKILSAEAPEYGTAMITGQNTLTWNLKSAGLTLNPTTIELSFAVMHIGTTGGTKQFNKLVTYEDRDGNKLDFGNPTVNVDCSVNPVIYPEPCPEPTTFEVTGCEDAAKVVMNSVELTSLGRIVQVDMTLKSICPGKRLAVSVLLSETGQDGIKQTRGLKHFLVPAQEGEECTDITLKCIQFSVPEELDTDQTANGICNSRTFEVMAIANYVDSDFACCDTKSVTI